MSHSLCPCLLCLLALIEFDSSLILPDTLSTLYEQVSGVFYLLSVYTCMHVIKLVEFDWSNVSPVSVYHFYCHVCWESLLYKFLEQDSRTRFIIRAHVSWVLVSHFLLGVNERGLHQPRRD